MPQDHYKVLGINSSASEEEVSRAFREKMRMWHPDGWQGPKKAEAEALVKKITLAYSVLSNAEKRAAYDEERPALVVKPGAGAPPVCPRCSSWVKEEEMRRLEGAKYCETCFWALVQERKKTRKRR